MIECWQYIQKSHVPADSLQLAALAPMYRALIIQAALAAVLVLGCRSVGSRSVRVDREQRQRRQALDI